MMVTITIVSATIAAILAYYVMFLKSDLKTTKAYLADIKSKVEKARLQTQDLIVEEARKDNLLREAMLTLRYVEESGLWTDHDEALFKVWRAGR